MKNKIVFLLLFSSQLFLRAESSMNITKVMNTITGWSNELLLISENDITPVTEISGATSDNGTPPRFSVNAQPVYYVLTSDIHFKNMSTLSNDGIWYINDVNGQNLKTLRDTINGVPQNQDSGAMPVGTYRIIRQVNGSDRYSFSITIRKLPPAPTVTITQSPGYIRSGDTTKLRFTVGVPVDLNRLLFVWIVKATNIQAPIWANTSNILSGQVTSVGFVVDPVAFLGSWSGGTYIIKTQIIEDGVLKRDGADNQFVVTIDDTPPTISLTISALDPIDPQGGYYKTLSFNAPTADDIGSGMVGQGKVEFKIIHDNVDIIQDWSLSTTFSLPYKHSKYTTGTYNVYIRAFDNLKNMSETIYTYKIDATAPFPAPPTAQLNLDRLSNPKSIILTAGAITENESGVANENTRFIFNNATITNSYLITNEWGTTLNFSVNATDNVGNSGEGSPLSIRLPKIITLLNCSLQLENPLDKAASKIIASLKLNISRAEIKDTKVKAGDSTGLYQKLIIKRKILADNTPGAVDTLLPDKEFVVASMYITTDSNDKWYEWIDPYNTTTKYLVFNDDLDASYGHKRIQYSIQQIMNMPAGVTSSSEDGFRIDSNSIIADLPNHPGQIHGIRLSDISSPATVIDDTLAKDTEITDFKLDKSLHAKISFKASDADGDSWLYKVVRSVMINGDPPVLSPKPISGDENIPLDPPQTAPVSVEAGWTTPVTVTLDYGQNDIYLAWGEKNSYGGVEQLFNSFNEKMISIYVKWIDGNFVITVTDPFAVNGADYIAIHPGEKFAIEVAPIAGALVDWDYEWNFEYDVDPTAELEPGSAIDHIYHQKPDQKTDTAIYTMFLKITGKGDQLGKDWEVKKPVWVIDTQIGSLFEDEVWKGPHTILGKVVIPPERTLTIQQVASGPQGSTSVDLEGGIVYGYAQGITVKPHGTLEILSDTASSPLVLIKRRVLPGQATPPDWDTLRIEGTATIKGADIKDAVRGITVTGTGSLTLIDSVLRQNGIGLHAVGDQCDVTVTGTAFTNNWEYGVKEDSGGNPDLDNTDSFSGNHWNYYDWIDGILTPKLIKERYGIVVEQGE